jgi:hypothetical protein
VPAARLLRLLFAFALLGALAACNTGGSEPGFKDVQIAEGAPIVIGVSTMLEGDLPRPAARSPTRPSSPAKTRRSTATPSSSSRRTTAVPRTEARRPRTSW